MKKIVLFGMIIVLIAGAAACSRPTAEKPGGIGGPDTTLMHLHGLGYSGDGKRLLIPAHSGIKIYADGKWSDAPGEKHDYMGFSVVDNGFYSSGHPVLDSAYSNPLGLVKSTDEGRSIKILALEGEADLHGMSAGYRTHTLYVLNEQANSKMKQSGLFYSQDEGKTWTGSRMSGVQGQIAALVVHPTQASVVAVGTTAGVFVSNDYGDSFTLLIADRPATSLAFMESGELLAAASAPKVELLRIDVKTKQQTAINVPVQGGDTISYVAGSPVQPKELAIATKNKEIYLSIDNGANWQHIADKGNIINRP